MTPRTNAKQNRSTSDLVHDLSEQTSQLIRQEIALAQTELTEKGAQAGVGIGLVAGAGILAL